MSDLTNDIFDAASARIRIRERRRMEAYDEAKRRRRRSTTKIDDLESSAPLFWEYHPSHNPFRVRARAASIAFSIDRAIKDNRYVPLPPTGFAVKKHGGGSRTVTAFSIADEVVSKRLYSTLMAKNRARLSPRSYAYRKDLRVHDAIAHVASEWNRAHRLYIAQYDFSDYFGSVSHDYVWRAISDLGIVTTRTERRLINAFLRAPYPTVAPKSFGDITEPRTVGIHQGTTVSLLLANIAATPLDRELERLGVSFVRYADDIVIWSRDYSNLGRAVEELHRFSDQSKCHINHEKSPGVRLLVESPAEVAEFRSARSIEFLSHEISLRSISIADRVMVSAKKKILDYIYNNLLREPIHGTQDLSRLKGGIDRDYVALMAQLRAFLYGSISESQLRRMLKGPIPPDLQLGGLIARHPMANDRDQVLQFDTWVSTRVWLAMRKRERLLAPYVGSTPKPWGLSQAELADFQTVSTSGSNQSVDARIPSTVLMSELVSRAVTAHGPDVSTYTTSVYTAM